MWQLQRNFTSAGKSIARIILNGLLHMSCLRPKVDFGTTKALRIWSSVSGRFKKRNLKMYAVFIDFIKVFDIVSREELCLVLKKFGCTQNVINLIKTLCNGMQANVVQGNEVLDQFAVTNCLKQGCVLASTLLSLCLTALLHVPSEM